MEENNNRVRIIITPQASSALSELTKNFNLEEDPEKMSDGKRSNVVVVSLLAKNFARQIMPEQSLVVSLEKELAISRDTAEKMSKEIITKIVPLLEKVPEERLEDLDFAVETAKRIFGEPTAEIPEIPDKKNDEEAASPAEEVKKTLPQQQQEQQTAKPSGPDSYREPIE